MSGFVVPDGGGARRFLNFGSESEEVTKWEPRKPTKLSYEGIPEEILADPTVQAAIEAVSAIKIGEVKTPVHNPRLKDKEYSAYTEEAMLPGQTEAAAVLPVKEVEDPTFPPGFEPKQKTETEREEESVKTLADKEAEEKEKAVQVKQGAEPEQAKQIHQEVIHKITGEGKKMLKKPRELHRS